MPQLPKSPINMSGLHIYHINNTAKLIKFKVTDNIYRPFYK
jgi:hypothetical protein